MQLTRKQIQAIDQVEDRNERMMAAAVMYAEAGFYVIPIRPNGKAIPPAHTGISYHQSAKNLDTIKRWYGAGGQFEGWNVGLACGKEDGIFVVDLDKGGKSGNGIRTFEAMTPEGWEHLGPVAETPNGGLHLLFKWAENGRCTTDKLGAGIDTRGGTADKIQGHIVAWPSTIADKAYKWKQVGALNEAPDWIISRMGDPLRSKGTGRGNEGVASTDVEDQFSTEQLVGILNIIDPNELSYDEWLQIGQAIHTQHPTEAGLEVWDTWSSTGDRYERGECHKRWSGFEEGGTIRIGTLLAHAKKRGFDLAQLNELKQEHQDKIEELVERMNQSYAMVPVGSGIMIVEELDLPDGHSVTQSRFQLRKRQAMIDWHQNEMQFHVDHNGKPRQMNVADIWLSHPNRRSYPMGIGMFPLEPQGYSGYFNLWNGFAVEASPSGSWGRLRAHIRDIVCAGDPRLFEWVLDWCADLIQDPANPKGCALVMHGPEGCGKGTFVQALGKIFGTHFKHVTDPEHLVGRFNSHLADSVLVFADEVVFGGDRKIAGKLKALVSENLTTLEKKGVDAIQMRNCVHLMVASNESWFIPAGPQSRRWLVLDMPGTRSGDHAYFDAIHEELKDGGYEAMFHELQNRKITSDLRRAPETNALQIQREQYTRTDSNLDWLFRQLRRGVLDAPALKAEEGDVDWPESVLKQDLLEAYHAWCNEHRRREVADGRFFESLKQLGFVDFRPRLSNGKRGRAVKIPPLNICEAAAKRAFGYVIDTIEGEENDD